ncbi:MAG TPA: 6-phosphofructokinase [Bacillota bacterium]|nr:6-phosphofructokinase [Peptococcaceae bacterium MAG4]NLW37327.1 6-phosphofructokinase [Peptococcaceae bacterium]HPZ43823.1 6-phosphofructokinase [Bacillota bacterium]HQD76325.1 6-phosphofructokinase [Bacillota bacterium]HUM59005.1 6-phosphofructokinase [Bacillota bacterium]
MASQRIRRIGVLTGGGDCPGLNAVIRAVVKTAIREYNLSVIGFENGFGGLIQNRARELTEKDVVGILPRGGTILGTTNRDNPFHYPVTIKGKTEFRDVSDRVIENINIHDIDALIVIGGDGSLTIAKKLFEEKGLPVVGVPKTIDNDLSATDQTFGFDTALTTATEAIDKLHTTAESHHRVMVLEVMGRYAGWIALQSGLAGGADVILIPEIPYLIERVIDKIMDRQASGKKFSIVVAAEGAREVGGQMVVQRMVPNSFEPVRLGGIGNVLVKQIEEGTGMEARVTVLGHLQRGGSPTAFDRVLATRYGAGAVNLVMAGRFGEMVCLRTPEIKSVALAEAVGELRLVPIDGDLVRTARQVGISFGD